MFGGDSGEVIVQRDTIIIFHPTLSFSQEAQVGILAHEIAHSFNSEANYDDDEAAADDLVSKWGFANERELSKQS